VSCISSAATAASAAVAGAQSLRLADSLIQRGAIQQAESLYYAAARAHPHDPQARLALGRYLESRGATRIAVTLVEEAVQFGLAPSAAGPILAPMYDELEQYPQLLSLPAGTLSPAERDRARWLAAHPSRTLASDSSVLMSYAPRSSSPLGSVTLRVNGRPVVLAIRSSGNGISVSEAVSTSVKLRRFPASAARSAVAAADSIGLSRVTLTNFPVTVESPPAGVDGSVSLEFLARFTPTFDPAADRMLLRIGATSLRSTNGTRLAIMKSAGELEMARAGGWVPLRLPQVSSMLKERRWTLDLRHGQIVVE